MERQDQGAGERGQTEVQRLKDDIQTGFSRINSAEGLKALQELVHEYEELQPVLDRGRETDPLAVAHIPALAEETYRQGLGVLVGCLDLMREIHSPNNLKLEAELADLESQVGAMEEDDTQPGASRYPESHRRFPQRAPGPDPAAEPAGRRTAAPV